MSITVISIAVENLKVVFKPLNCQLKNKNFLLKWNFLLNSSIIYFIFVYKNKKKNILT